MTVKEVLTYLFTPDEYIIALKVSHRMYMQQYEYAAEWGSLTEALNCTASCTDPMKLLEELRPEGYFEGDYSPEYRYAESSRRGVYLPGICWMPYTDLQMFTDEEMDTGLRRLVATYVRQGVPGDIPVYIQTGEDDIQRFRDIKTSISDQLGSLVTGMVRCSPDLILNIPNIQSGVYAGTTLSLSVSGMSSSSITVTCDKITADNLLHSLALKE